MLSVRDSSRARGARLWEMQNENCKISFQLLVISGQRLAIFAHFLREQGIRGRSPFDKLRANGK